MTISEFIDFSNRAASPFELFNRLIDAATPIGYDYIAYASLEGSGRWGRDASAAPAMLLNFPAAWEKHYRSRSYHRIDPVFQFAHVSGRPFFWAEMPQVMALSTEQQALLKEAISFGLLDGACVPLYGPKGGVAIMSFAASRPNPHAGSNLGYLNALAAQFHLAYMRFAPIETAPEPSPVITRRERECLQWIARGKSSADIAVILGISENTVNFHIKKLLAKLEVHSRTVAVLRAQQLGLLD
ncbi:LuxR family transcriptional regulator [Pedomonas mirosovicensis]|uniref:LuxR family transcriptional regulator n=1 Tax=Pedomonas mirosovicensis TaxID=2908641 RepID=UPI00216940FE|nr:LuxR family transcriptional regulator [Pedomonas mirosovicensis]MCH8683719.1 LuxR family transcriptional regulator [Pedomonas mirosovicensis]MCH8686153.1 LuxR family transcriptional regulator [Pedomonas mirosovicensis]